MKIIQPPSILGFLSKHTEAFFDLFLIWLFCRLMTPILIIVMIFLAIKYSAYIPDNPNYRRNYDDIKVLPRNPFTEAPATMKQSEIDAINRKNGR